MKKMMIAIVIIIMIIAVFLGVMLGLGSWLDYDQMNGCSVTPTGDAPCQKADAIVAVSGGDTSARALKAARLYKENFAPKIIFSGAAADPTSPSNAATMAKLAETNGVPASAILLDETSRNTSQNADNVAQILKKNGWTNVILVSENYHLRRAYSDFVAADNQASFRTTAAKKQTFWWITPRGWWLIFNELGGMSKTAVKG